METITAGFIGLGLIGGSIARGLKRDNRNIRIMAYMRTRSKLEQAQNDGVVDDILDSAEDSRLAACDIIFLCTPVEFNEMYLEDIRPLLKKGALVTDVGSTKESVHRTVEKLGMNPVFAGGHPMAGSEKTGYENSTDHLLENAYYIITPTPETPPELTGRLRDVAKAIGAIPMVIDYHRHDRIVAAISHLPHLIAATLVNLVHDSDTADQLMKTLAAGGFKDLTRIASSSPVMWEQICMTNTDNIVDITDRYIASLAELRNRLANRQEGAVFELFSRSRDYRNSFPDMHRGSIMPDFSFSVDCVDEPGVISIISSILAVAGINIRNIGINNNREMGEGAMEISFYDRESMEKAALRLSSYNYKIFRR